MGVIQALKNSLCKLVAGAAIGATLAFAGCATNKSVLDSNAPAISSQDESTENENMGERKSRFPSLFSILQDDGSVMFPPERVQRELPLPSEQLERPEERPEDLEEIVGATSRRLNVLFFPDFCFGDDRGVNRDILTTKIITSYKTASNKTKIDDFNFIRLGFLQGFDDFDETKKKDNLSGGITAKSTLGERYETFGCLFKFNQRLGRVWHIDVNYEWHENKVDKDFYTLFIFPDTSTSETHLDINGYSRSHKTKALLASYKDGEGFGLGFSYFNNCLKLCTKDKKTGAVREMVQKDCPKIFYILFELNIMSLQLGKAVDDYVFLDRYDRFNYSFFNLVFLTKPVCLVLSYQYTGVPYYLGEDSQEGRLTVAIPLSKNYAWERTLFELKKENIEIIERSFQKAEGSFHRNNFNPEAMTISLHYCNPDCQNYSITVPITSRIGIIAEYLRFNGKKLGTLNLVFKW